MFVASINKRASDLERKSNTFGRLGMKVIFEKDIKGFEKAEMPRVNRYL